MSGVIDLTSDDDEAQEARSPQNKDTLSDGEDEDLKLAIALSLQDQTNTNDTAEASAKPVEVSQLSTVPINSPSAQVSSGLLGLDRKAMEAERLARLKRKREPESDTQTSPRPLSQPSSISSRISPPPPRKQKAGPAHSTTVMTKLSTNKTSTTPHTFQTPQILLTSEPSRRDPIDSSKYTSISFADIIAPPSATLNLRSTLLSSFIADFDWILPHFNTRTTAFLLVLHAQNAQHRTLLESDFAGLSNVKLVIPEVMSGSGNMHSKVMLLFYQSSSTQDGSDGDRGEEICRVVIPSANLTRTDWGVGGVMENVVFVVDLPLKNGRDDTDYRFERKLRAQLAALGTPENVLRKLGRFDFAATKGIEFVHSASGSNPLNSTPANKMTGSGAGEFFQQGRAVGLSGHDPGIQSNGSRAGEHGIDDPARTGLLSLNDAVVSLGLDTSSDNLNDLPQVDFITSSLGNLTIEFVRQLYLAICGQLDPTKIIAKAKRSSAKPVDLNTSLDKAILQNLKIYFPSSGTVHRSKGGLSAGGTICFQRKWWDSNSLIRQCLHDCVGVRGDGILMHSKILYVRFKTPKVAHENDGHEKLYLGWAYVGSANLSESAWGRIVSDAKSKQPKLTCRNWESGIVVPVEMGIAVQKRAPKDEAAARIQTDLGRQDAILAKGTSSEAKTENALRRATSVVATSGKKVVMQVEVGNEGNTNRSETGGPGEVIVSDENREAGTISARMQEKDVGGVRELPSLFRVFSQVVPVPLRCPAPSHVARQQTPWFFME